MNVRFFTSGFTYYKFTFYIYYFTFYISQVMRQLQSNIQPYSKTIARLLRKEIESNDKEWDNLLTYQTPIQDYLSVIGLELIVKKHDGYAFVRQFEINEDGHTIGLTLRYPLSFEVSVIGVVLAEMLFEFKESLTEIYATERFVRHREIKERAEFFFPDKTDKVSFSKSIDRSINKAIDLGFLKIHQKKTDNIDDQQYIIKKIIQEKFTTEVLSVFNEKLKAELKP